MEKEDNLAVGGIHDKYMPGKISEKGGGGNPQTKTPQISSLEKNKTTPPKNHKKQDNKPKCESVLN